MYMYNSNKFALGALIIIPTIAIGFILYLAYQSIVVIPRENLEKQIEAARQEAITKEIKYNQCMVSAYEVYSANWDNHCIMLGLEKDCTLPMTAASSFDQKLSDEKDRCVTLHK